MSIEKHRNPAIRRALPLAAGALVAASCATAAPKELEPADAAQEVAGIEDAAVASDQQVTVVAQAAGWPGDARISQEVIPIRVAISNRSPEPVRIRYEDFQLVASEDKRFAAIPPLQAEGAVPELDAAASLAEPDIAYSGFMVAPHLSYAYPGIPAYPDAFDYDYGYYTAYYDTWDEAWLPTREMLQRALPEGVLQSGGEIEGFVYFERLEGVAADEGPVSLQVDLEAAETGDDLATVSIPFAVTEG